MSRFVPHPLVPGGHLQTLAGAYLIGSPSLAGTLSHPIELADGDQLILHEDHPPKWSRGQPVAMLVHGLCGCHRSSYMQRLALKLFHRGVRVFRLDLRGCGAGEGLAKRGTHCGRWNDLRPPIVRIGQLCGDSPLTVVGFSLGGALVLNLAAEQEQRADVEELEHWQQAIAVCPPVDLQEVERHLRAPLNRPYDRYFAKRLWRQMQRRSRLLPKALQVADLPPPKRLRELDERVTAPQGGYRSVDDYYQQASVASRLARIRLPTQIIAAANDPIVPVAPLQQSELGANTRLTITPCGGHLGYLGRRNGDPDRCWLDWRLVEGVLQTR